MLAKHFKRDAANNHYYLSNKGYQINHEGKSMSYITESLGNNENIVEQFEFHWSIWISFLALIIIAIMSFIGWIIFTPSQSTDKVSFYLLVSIACAVSAVYEIFDVKSRVRALTNKRIFSKSGIVSVRTEEARLPQIETIELRRGIIDRLLNRGALKITGTGASSMVITHLKKPNSAKKQ